MVNPSAAWIHRKEQCFRRFSEDTRFIPRSILLSPRWMPFGMCAIRKHRVSISLQNPCTSYFIGWGRRRRKDATNFVREDCALCRVHYNNMYHAHRIWWHGSLWRLLYSEPTKLPFLPSEHLSCSHQPLCVSPMLPSNPLRYRSHGSILSHSRKLSLHLIRTNHRSQRIYLCLHGLYRPLRGE